MKTSILFMLLVVAIAGGCVHYAPLPTTPGDAVVRHPQKKLGISDQAMEYHRQGEAFEKAGDLERAIDAFKSAISVQPEHASLHNSLGYAYLNAKRFEEAKTTFEHALRLSPNFACPHFGLFRYYLAKGDEEAARREFNIFARMDPKSAKRILDEIKKSQQQHQQQ